jgi:8-oxo-dGTP pyrophosphatase MutT (NUDIX family)
MTAPDPSDFREPHLPRGDFLGAFGLHETAGGILMVRNERTIGGRRVATWDLPGGQVEPGELLVEALQRELREELGVSCDGAPRFLFFQEGEKLAGAVRRYAWRSFFFALPALAGTLGTGSDPLPWRYVPRAGLQELLHAPYHDSFLAWLAQGGSAFSSRWVEPD